MKQWISVDHRSQTSCAAAMEERGASNPTHLECSFRTGRAHRGRCPLDTDTDAHRDRHADTRTHRHSLWDITTVPAVHGASHVMSSQRKRNNRKTNNQNKILQNTLRSSRTPAHARTPTPRMLNPLVHFGLARTNETDSDRAKGNQEQTNSSRTHAKKQFVFTMSAHIHTTDTQTKQTNKQSATDAKCKGAPDPTC